MVPLVAVVACDGVAIVVVVSAKAADLAVILLRAVHVRQAITVGVGERDTVRDRYVSGVVPVDSRGRVEVVGHAIAPVVERVVRGFM